MCHKTKFFKIILLCRIFYTKLTDLLSDNSFISDQSISYSSNDLSFCENGILLVKNGEITKSTVSDGSKES